MANYSPSFMVLAIAAAVCFFGAANGAGQEDKQNHFVVHGTVYCDTCNVQFVTKLSTAIGGAKVKLECVDYANDKNVTLREEATTDVKGGYRFEVEGDHAEEDCQVTLVSSSRADCSEMDSKNEYNYAAKVSLTNDNGLIHSPDRLVNALGFMINQPLPGCPQALKDLSLNPDGSEIQDNMFDG